MPRVRRFQQGPGFGPAYIAKGGALGMGSMCLLFFGIVLFLPAIVLLAYSASDFGVIEKGGPFDDPFFTKDGYDKFADSKGSMRIVGAILLVIGIIMVVTSVAFCIYLAKISQRAMNSSDGGANQPMNTTTTIVAGGPTTVVHPPPQAASYPPPHGQHPHGQAQYPPPQSQYPTPQSQYPPPQGQYPSPHGQYPPPQGKYPMGEPYNAPGQYPQGGQYQAGGYPQGGGYCQQGYSPAPPPASAPPPPSGYGPPPSGYEAPPPSYNNYQEKGQY